MYAGNDDSSSSSFSSSSSSSDDDDDDDAGTAAEEAAVEQPDYRTQLVSLLQEHAPERLPFVDAVLERYVGREDALLRQLRQKYESEEKQAEKGEQEDDGAQPPVAAAAAAAAVAAAAGPGQQDDAATPSQAHAARTAELEHENLALSNRLTEAQAQAQAEQRAAAASASQAHATRVAELERETLALKARLAESEAQVQAQAAQQSRVAEQRDDAATASLQAHATRVAELERDNLALNARLVESEAQAAQQQQVADQQSVAASASQAHAAQLAEVRKAASSQVTLLRKQLAEARRENQVLDAQLMEAEADASRAATLQTTLTATLKQAQSEVAIATEKLERARAARSAAEDEAAKLRADLAQAMRERDAAREECQAADSPALFFGDAERRRRAELERLIGGSVKHRDVALLAQVQRERELFEVVRAEAQASRVASPVGRDMVLELRRTLRALALLPGFVRAQALRSAVFTLSAVLRRRATTRIHDALRKWRSEALEERRTALELESQDLDAAHRYIKQWRSKVETPTGEELRRQNRSLAEELFAARERYTELAMAAKAHAAAVTRARVVAFAAALRRQRPDAAFERWAFRVWRGSADAEKIRQNVHALEDKITALQVECDEVRSAARGHMAAVQEVHAREIASMEALTAKIATAAQRERGITNELWLRLGHTGRRGTAEEEATFASGALPPSGSLVDVRVAADTVAVRLSVAISIVDHLTSIVSNVDAASMDKEDKEDHADFGPWLQRILRAAPALHVALHAVPPGIKSPVAKRAMPMEERANAESFTSERRKASMMQLVQGGLSSVLSSVASPPGSKAEAEAAEPSVSLPPPPQKEEKTSVLEAAAAGDSVARRKTMMQNLIQRGFTSALSGVKTETERPYAAPSELPAKSPIPAKSPKEALEDELRTGLQCRIFYLQGAPKQREVRMSLYLPHLVKLAWGGKTAHRGKSGPNDAGITLTASPACKCLRGKRTEVFEHGSGRRARFAEELCLSVVTDGGSLDMAVETAERRDRLAQGFDDMLSALRQTAQGGGGGGRGSGGGGGRGGDDFGSARMRGAEGAPHVLDRDNRGDAGAGVDLHGFVASRLSAAMLRFQAALIRHKNSALARALPVPLPSPFSNEERGGVPGAMQLGPSLLALPSLSDLLAEATHIAEDDVGQQSNDAQEAQGVTRLGEPQRRFAMVVLRRTKARLMQAHKLVDEVRGERDLAIDALAAEQERLAESERLRLLVEDRAAQERRDAEHWQRLHAHDLRQAGLRVEAADQRLAEMSSKCAVLSAELEATHQFSQARSYS